MVPAGIPALVAVLFVTLSLLLFPFSAVGEDIALPDPEEVVAEDDHTHENRSGRTRRGRRGIPRFQRDVSGLLPGAGRKSSGR
jgi:hypothetical protein